MRVGWLALSLGFAAPAFAQDAQWVVADTPSVRFADADTAGPAFKKDEKVEILAHDGARVRVRDGDSYGWIAATALTSTQPAAPSPVDEGAAAADVLQQIQQQEGKGPGAPPPKLK